MMRMLVASLSVWLAASGPAPGEGEGEGSSTPDEFLSRGAPTFVAGTSGDERATAAIRAQIDLMRGLFFPGARVLTDESIDVQKGVAGWPRNPVVYGGPHVNLVLADLGDVLPFRMAPGVLDIGGRTLQGDDVRLLAVVPARPGDAKGPGHPEFLLYAGTGTLGIGEINAVTHGRDPASGARRFRRRGRRSCLCSAAISSGCPSGTPIPSPASSSRQRSTRWESRR